VVAGFAGAAVSLFVVDVSPLLDFESDVDDDVLVDSLPAFPF